MTEEIFWHSNPRLMKPYLKAYEEKAKEDFERQNIMMYIQGVYFKDALSCVIGNMFKGKNEKPIEYPSEPYRLFKNKEENRELTEEEKIEQTNQLFTRLSLLKANYDIAHS